MFRLRLKNHHQVWFIMECSIMLSRTTPDYPIRNFSLCTVVCERSVDLVSELFMVSRVIILKVKLAHLFLDSKWWTSLKKRVFVDCRFENEWYLSWPFCKWKKAWQLHLYRKEIDGSFCQCEYFQNLIVIAGQSVEGSILVMNSRSGFLWIKKCSSVRFVLALMRIFTSSRSDLDDA